MFRGNEPGSYRLHHTILVPTWADITALWVSFIVSPPICLLAITILATTAIPDFSAWSWVVLHAFLAIAMPLLYTVRLHRIGAVSDYELNVRMERVRPLIVTLAGQLTSLLVLQWGSAPSILVLVATLCVMQTSIFLLITLWWKISAHAFTAAGLAVTGMITMGMAAAPYLSIALLVLWSRMHLRRHTFAQTLAGALLGCGLWLIGLLGQ